MNLSKAAKVTRVSNAVSAGTDDVESSSVDMQGFEACQFLVMFGTITAGAVTNIHVEGSFDDTNWDDLTGTAVTVADDDDNQVFGVDIPFPQHRYLRCVVDRGSENAVVDGVVALQYKADRAPVSQPATTTIETHHAPAVGTA